MYVCKSHFRYESPTKAPSFIGAFVENLYTKGGLGKISGVLHGVVIVHICSGW